jgi:hypothetical protein
MKKLVTIAVTIAVFITVFGAYHHVKAQSSERPGSPLTGNRPASPPVVLANHTLLATYIDQGDRDVTLAAGFTAIDSPVTINCQSTAGCTIGAESWTQVGDQSSSGNQWAICTEVDGSIAGICPFIGELPTDGTYQTLSLNNAIAVSVGTHTVQAFVYVIDAGPLLLRYNNTYHLYRP